MASASLKNKHLADLHALAAERGIKHFRMLSRDELVEQLDGSDQEPEPGEPVSGVLEITSRGHGFIRPDDPDAEGDVYVSPSQIRRCELQAGDVISGPARPPRRGERHPALIHIDTVNGSEPGGERSNFEELEAKPPHRRLPLSGEGAGEDVAVLLRSIDLLTPLARGQRVLVNAGRGSGRTALLRALAVELGRVEDLEVSVVLIDERPEEQPAWRKALGDVALTVAGAEMRSGEQLRAVELAVAQAKRKAEAGADAVLIIDSLSRLAVAADDPGATKPIFGAGRETAEEGAGSLTVIATVLTDGDDGVGRALATTENVAIALSGELAEAGVVPSIEVAGCRVVGEQELRDEAELAAARALRAELAELSATEAAQRLAERLRSEPSNEALLASLAK
jgi:transcription termination factor Rho